MAASNEYQAGEYQRLDIKQYPSRSLRETAEGKYWRRFKAPIVAQQVRLPSVIGFRTQWLQHG
jgi:U3 small nucleolar RNA-associated protein 15